MIIENNPYQHGKTSFSAKTQKFLNQFVTSKISKKTFCVFESLCLCVHLIFCVTFLVCHLIFWVILLMCPFDLLCHIACVSTGSFVSHCLCVRLIFCVTLLVCPLDLLCHHLISCVTLLVFQQDLFCHIACVST